MAQEYHFGDFTLDQSRYLLQRGDRILSLEKRPMELLILLVERRGELVTREKRLGARVRSIPEGSSWVVAHRVLLETLGSRESM